MPSVVVDAGGQEFLEMASTHYSFLCFAFLLFVDILTCQITGTYYSRTLVTTDSFIRCLSHYLAQISRSYCRYFGGDLSIMSMEGYGTDAFVYLTRLGNSREPLPM